MILINILFVVSVLRLGFTMGEIAFDNCYEDRVFLLDLPYGIAMAACLGALVF